VLITKSLQRKPLVTVLIITLLSLQSVPVSAAPGMPQTEQQYSMPSKPATDIPAPDASEAQPLSSLGPPPALNAPPQTSPVTMVIAQTTARSNSAEIAVAVSQTQNIPALITLHYHNTGTVESKAIASTIPHDGMLTFNIKNLEPSTDYEVLITSKQNGEQVAVLEDSFQTKESDALNSPRRN